MPGTPMEEVTKETKEYNEKCICPHARPISYELKAPTALELKYMHVLELEYMHALKL